jgi:hypothetical protein
MLIIDRFLGLTWDLYFKDNRLARTIIKLLSTFALFLKVQFNVTVKLIESNNDIFSIKIDVKR